MNSIPFLRPRLTGLRFDDHSIPLEVLKDFAILEELIIEVAKWKYLKANPNRRRARRGFTGDFELKLTGVNEGSAIPLISLVLASGTLLPSANQAYLEEGRDAVIYAIAAAEQDKPISEYVPDHVLGYFDRIGRSLRDGEAIEFITETRTTPARLTRDTRRKLVLASSTFKELSEEITTRGSVPEIDQADMTFEIQLPDGGPKVVAPIDPQHIDTILEAAMGFRKGSQVLIQGIGKYNRTYRLQGFESIQHISILDALDVPTRLDEFRSLQDVWLDGKGRAPARGHLDWLEAAFDQHYPDDLPLPYLYPTPEGGVQAEWSIGSHEVSLEVDLQEHFSNWHDLNIATNADESLSLNLDHTDDWERLANLLRKCTGAAA